jgi:hypothetical protein
MLAVFTQTLCLQVQFVKNGICEGISWVDGRQSRITKKGKTSNSKKSVENVCEIAWVVCNSSVHFVLFEKRKGKDNNQILFFKRGLKKDFSKPGTIK